MKKYTIKATIEVCESENKYSSGTKVFEAETSVVSTVQHDRLDKECNQTLVRLSNLVSNSVILPAPDPAEPLDSEPLPEQP